MSGLQGVLEPNRGSAPPKGPAASVCRSGRVRKARVMSIECPHCGYDLRGLVEGRCPECGFGYDHEGLRALRLDARLHREANDNDIVGHALLVAAILVFTGGRPSAMALVFGIPKGLLLGYALTVSGVFDLTEPPRRWWLLPLFASGVSGCVALAFLLMAAPPLARVLAAGVALRMILIARRQPARATFEPDPLDDPGPAYRLLSTKARLCYVGALAWTLLAWVPGACV